MQINKSRRPAVLVLALAAALSLAACGKGQSEQAAAAPPAPKVTVVEVRSTSVPLMLELPGRTTASLIAEVRPQVTGLVKQRVFSEGADIKAGDLLYQIDPSTYQAVYDAAAAALVRAEANRDVARLTAERYAGLIGIQAVSKQANDEAQAAFKLAEADVASARAALEQARVDLAFTKVTAPITGRAGRSSVTPGALVTANQADSLVTIQRLDPIYVDLTQSSAELLKLRRDLADGRLSKDGADSSMPVRLLLEDGSEYALPGRLGFSEVSVDPGTGSVTLRTVFPNPEGELLPGMYVRASIEQGIRNDVILVPQAALSRDPKGNALVMVVNAENKVESRIVNAERTLQDSWVIGAGLKDGERVIVAGLQQVRPGIVVDPQAAAAAPASAPAN